MNTKENEKLIKDSMRVYSAFSGENSTDGCGVKRVISIHIENDAIGDKFFTPIVADTLIKIAAMIKDGTAGNGQVERFIDRNGNVAIILGGRVSEEENIPSPNITNL
ncbi:hypothetical protein DJ252_18465 [Salmonella enterica subsp. enterica serovar Uzaramo]|uniref:Uncharacterized protein n=1 Tax=Salmonella enterica TaxID=28901 RepID=A0A759WA24_SALER|nr:hypothetical protein [Salmonella enterica]EEE9946932.1 hypothetical protein [Salmonella enterica subsp. enterica serovar Uzaramo]EIM5531730.1 hypothetical protein [Salmonella enterica subsp. enterica]ELD8107752.1 hypothetical protein [Salmonella enterica subsp. enterica serovar Benin]EBB6483900.1 hypothetical protein [Salmonella enterica]